MRAAVRSGFARGKALASTAALERQAEALRTKPSFRHHRVQPGLGLA